MSSILAPIIVFTESNIDNIIINERLWIRRIKSDEFIELFGVQIDFRDQRVKRYTRVNDANFWAEIPKGNAQLISLGPHVYPYYLIEADTREDLEDLLFSLRLLYEKTVVCPKGIDNQGRTIFFFRPFNMTQKTFFTASDIATIPTNDLNRIVKCFDLVGKYRENDQVVRARLNICLNLEQSEPIRFIEAIGIMESILCGNSRDELRFRFSLFSYYILKRLNFNVSRRSLQELYDIRSGLVHSGKHSAYSKEKLEHALKYVKAVYLESRRDNLDGSKILRGIEATI